MSQNGNARSLRIALMGTRGVPARYGGFETAMEEIGQRMAALGHDVTVYCRRGNSGETPEPTHYLGMNLVHLPAMRRRALETLTHSFLSAGHALGRRQKYDAVLLCNAANAVVLPMLRVRRMPVAVHVDGLEWRRAKWGPAGQTYYRNAESLSVRWADALVADARGIQQYYTDEFNATSDFIPYGAPDLDSVSLDRLGELDLTPDGYHLVVARMEPENHVDLIVEGYLESSAQLPLIVVGSNPFPSDHTRAVTDLAARSDQVRLIGGVWDQDLLDQLYKGARTYLHGHSVGGTNPSLLRGLAGGTPVIAFDVAFNHEAAHGARFAKTPAEFAQAITEAEAQPPASAEQRTSQASRVRADYDWDQVTADYLDLLARLAGGDSQRGRFSGRRTGLWTRGSGAP